MKNPDPRILSRIVPEFDVDGAWLGAEPYGNGHINDTFLVGCRGRLGIVRYLFQRINTRIFRHPDHLMENIARVTRHIRRKLEAQGAADIDRRTLTLVPTCRGRTHFTDPEGGVWRGYLFIHPSLSRQTAANARQARECGRAFGGFQAQLADLPGGPLHETIPFFHDVDRRIENLEQAVRRDAYDRARETAPELDFVFKQAGTLSCLTRLYRDGAVPARITHNDTKFNNVLLDPEERALCVIDLDTVMNGTVLYDYGDALRTVASTAEEDEPEVRNVRFDLDRFRAFTEGYLEAIGPLLEPLEWETLSLAPAAMTYTIGLRFLTDYLDGDVYFKTRRPGHNRTRARAQFALCRDMLARRPAMDSFLAVARKRG